MTPKRKRLCQPLIRGSRYSLAKKCLDDEETRKYLIKCIGKTLQNEIANLCSNKHSSILKDKSKQAMESFSWDKLVAEMEINAPMLLSLLNKCTETPRTSRPNRQAIIGTICGILCKNRNHSACLFQRIVSILLYSGHSSKSVSD